MSKIRGQHPGIIVVDDLNPKTVSREKLEKYWNLICNPIKRSWSSPIKNN